MGYIVAYSDLANEKLTPWFRLIKVGAGLGYIVCPGRARSLARRWPGSGRSPQRPDWSRLLEAQMYRLGDEDEEEEADGGEEDQASGSRDVPPDTFGERKMLKAILESGGQGSPPGSRTGSGCPLPALCQLPCGALQLPPGGALMAAARLLCR